ncbi:hypothetical protein Hanom_Chr17g01587811 [Helianthus anomalus]
MEPNVGTRVDVVNETRASCFGWVYKTRARCQCHVFCVHFHCCCWDKIGHLKSHVLNF